MSPSLGYDTLCSYRYKREAEFGQLLYDISQLKRTVGVRPQFLGKGHSNYVSLRTIENSYYDILSVVYRDSRAILKLMVATWYCVFGTVRPTPQFSRRSSFTGRCLVMHSRLAYARVV